MHMIAKRLLFLLLCLAAHGATAQTAPPGKVTGPHPTWNYADVYRSGNLLFISGVPGNGTMDQALERVYSRLGNILKQQGVDWTHVVKENLYATDLDAVAQHKAIRQQRYGSHTPAATWVQVQRLAEPTASLEVDLVVELEKQ